MKDVKQSIEVAISNLLRLNRLRIAKKLNKDTWQEFFMYRNILKAKDVGEYSEEINNIINKQMNYEKD